MPLDNYTHVKLDAKYVITKCEEKITELHVAINLSVEMYIHIHTKPKKIFGLFTIKGMSKEEAEHQLHSRDNGHAFFPMLDVESPYEEMTRPINEEINRTNKLLSLAKRSLEHGDGFVYLSTEDNSFLFDD